MEWAGGMFLLLPACRGGPVGLGCREHPLPLESTQTLQTGQEGQGTAAELIIVCLFSTPGQTWGGFLLSAKHGGSQAIFGFICPIPEAQDQQPPPSGLSGAW